MWLLFARRANSQERTPCATSIYLAPTAHRVHLLGAFTFLSSGNRPGMGILHMSHVINGALISYSYQYCVSVPGACPFPSYTTPGRCSIAGTVVDLEIRWNDW
eukprot:scpid103241/ scgid32443/ 